VIGLRHAIIFVVRKEQVTTVIELEVPLPPKSAPATMTLVALSALIATAFPLYFVDVLVTISTATDPVFAMAVPYAHTENPPIVCTLGDTLLVYTGEPKTAQAELLTNPGSVATEAPALETCAYAPLLTTILPSRVAIVVGVGMAADPPLDKKFVRLYANPSVRPGAPTKRTVPLPLKPTDRPNE